MTATDAQSTCLMIKLLMQQRVGYSDRGVGGLPDGTLQKIQPMD